MDKGQTWRYKAQRGYRSYEEEGEITKLSFRLARPIN